MMQLQKEPRSAVLLLRLISMFAIVVSAIVSISIVSNNFFLFSVSLPVSFTV